MRNEHICFGSFALRTVEYNISVFYLVDLVFAFNSRLLDGEINGEL